MKEQLKKMVAMGESNPKLRAIIICGLGLVFLIVIWVVYNVFQSDNASSRVGDSSISAPRASSSGASAQPSPERLKALRDKAQQEQKESMLSGKSFISSGEDGGSNAVNQTALAKSSSNSVMVNGQSVSLSEYAADLARQVQNKTLTSEQANTILMAQLPDLSPDIQNSLQKATSDAEYTANLKRLVNEGRLTPEQATALFLAKIPPNAALAFKALADQNLSPEDYQKALLRKVASGELTLDQAKAFAVTKGLNPSLLSQRYAEHLAGLVASGKITTAQAKSNMVSQGLDPAMLNTVVASPNPSEDLGGSSSAPTFAQLASQYAIPSDAASQLAALQRKGVSEQSYAKKLGELVLSGKITKEAALALMNNYKALTVAANDLEKMVGPLSAEQAQANQTQLLQEQQQQLAEEQTKQAAHDTLLQAMSAAMLQQQNTIIASTASPIQEVQVALPPEKAAPGSADGNQNDTSKTDKSAKPVGPMMIKQGTILYAVLETTVNSDYSSTPVVAQIVAGKLKGTTLMGQFTTAQNGERVTLQFTSMTNDAWPDVKQISAFAIDPQSSRIAIASSVNHHYFSRYASILASSFLQGYGQSLQNTSTIVIPSQSGSTQVTQNELTPAQRLAVGLGQVGQNLSQAAMENFNRAPTVRVDAGVGIGILFTAGVPAA